MNLIDMFPYVILGLVGYLMVYAIIDRICKCCEQCALCKSYGEFMRITGKTEVEKK